MGNIFRFRQLTAEIFLLTCREYFARVVGSREILYLGVSCLLGFSLARLGHSIMLATISAKIPAATVTIKAQPMPEVPSAIDPSSILGGVLFQAANIQSMAKQEFGTEVGKPFKLTGTLEGEKDISRALIEVQGQSIREYCAIGQTCKSGECACKVENAHVLSIAKEQIWLKIGNERVMLRLGQSTADRNKGPAGPEPQNLTTSQTVINQNISREDVLKILQGKEGRIFEAQFGPHVIDGKIQGYKISRVADDHIFAKLGAKSGDIIRKVNGYSLDDMERLMDLYKALRTMSDVRIELDRNGKNLLYNFHVRN
jgi:type II secretory pathway component PulC